MRVSNNRHDCSAELRTFLSQGKVSMCKVLSGSVHTQVSVFIPEGIS